MLPTLATEVPKEHVADLHFPNSPVLLSAEHRAALSQKLHKAMVLGNQERGKCRILFKDDGGMKFVRTTIWSADEERIVLKSGVTIPVARVIDVELI